MNIKVSRRNNRLGQSPLGKLPEDTYFRCRLSEYFADSRVRCLYLHRNCILEAAALVGRSKALAGKGAVPEAGGFLLGRYMEKDGAYELTAEVFLPVEEVEEQSNISLTMGIGIGLAYARVMDDYPQLGIVGWFHTHPGHTPFLSETDLNKTHIKLFSAPYQVAIVLDSLTEKLDTGIFPWRSDGGVNNAEDMSNWIHWKSLLDWASIPHKNEKIT